MGALAYVVVSAARYSGGTIEGASKGDGEKIGLVGGCFVGRENACCIG